MKTPPRVTVFMPVYNSELYLDDSIQSILNQSFKDFEFIIINDGSTDNSLSLIRSYEKKDKRIRVISRMNKGIPYTRNEGLFLAKGEYIALMDSDDISLPERLYTQVGFLDSHKDILVCGTAIQFFNQASHNIRYEENPEINKIKLLFNSVIANPTACFRRVDVLKNNIKYKDSDIYAQDYRFWVSLSRVGKISNIRQVYCLYRCHPKQVGQRYYETQRQIANDIVREQLEYLGVYLSLKELELFRMGDFHGKQMADNYCGCVSNLRVIHSVFIKVIDANKAKKIYHNDLLIKYLKIKFINIILLYDLKGVLFYLRHIKGEFKNSNSILILIVRFVSRSIKKAWEN